MNSGKLRNIVALNLLVTPTDMPSVILTSNFERTIPLRFDGCISTTDPLVGAQASLSNGCAAGRTGSHVQRSSGPTRRSAVRLLTKCQPADSAIATSGFVSNLKGARRSPCPLSRCVAAKEAFTESSCSHFEDNDKRPISQSRREEAFSVASVFGSNVWIFHQDLVECPNEMIDIGP